MIATVKGLVAEIAEDSLVVEIGGIGVRVYVSARMLNEIQPGERVALHTYLIVRETELSLYGFSTGEERRFFELLLGVNGVGPRLALMVLSTMNPNAIRRAVFNEQVEIFNRVPGVGKKTAQKILLHLQDKVKDADGLAPVAAMDDADSQVLEALTAMGFSIVEAQAALQIIPKDSSQDVEERLRLALSYFDQP